MSLWSILRWLGLIGLVASTGSTQLSIERLISESQSNKVSFVFSFPSPSPHIPSPRHGSCREMVWDGEAKG